MSETSSYRQGLQDRLEAQRALIAELIHPHASSRTGANTNTEARHSADEQGTFPRSVLMRTVTRHPASLGLGLLGLLVVGPRRAMRIAAWSIPILRTQSVIVGQLTRVAPLMPMVARAVSGWIGGRRHATRARR